MGGLTRPRTGYGYRPKVASSVDFTSSGAAKATGGGRVAAGTPPRGSHNPRFSRLAQSVDSLQQLQVQMGSNLHANNLRVLHEPAGGARPPVIPACGPAMPQARQGWASAACTHNPGSPMTRGSDAYNVDTRGTDQGLLQLQRPSTPSTTVALLRRPGTSCSTGAAMPSRPCSRGLLPTRPPSAPLVSTQLAETNRPWSPCGQAIWSSHDMLESSPEAARCQDPQPAPAAVSRPTTPMVVDVSKAGFDALRPPSRGDCLVCGTVPVSVYIVSRKDLRNVYQGLGADFRH
jgi:hypothetical protein